MNNSNQYRIREIQVEVEPGKFSTAYVPQKNYGGWFYENWYNLMSFGFSSLEAANKWFAEHFYRESHPPKTIGYHALNETVKK